VHPQRHRGGRQRRPDRRITGRRKRPIEGRAEVVDPGSVIGQPFGPRPCLRLDFGPLEKIPVIFGVATCEPFAFPAFAELFERVGPRRVEQAVARDAAVNLRRGQRLRDQIGKTVNDFRRRKLWARHNRTGRLPSEGTGKDRQAAQEHAFGLGQQLVAPVERRP